MTRQYELPAHITANAERASGIRRMFLEAGQMAEAGARPVDLSLGNPSEGPPPDWFGALEGIIREYRDSPDNPHRYANNAGFDATRARIASDLSERYQLPFILDNIVMTVGAVNGIDVLLMALLEPVLDRNSGNQTLRKNARWGWRIVPDQGIIIKPYFVDYFNYVLNRQGCPIAVPANEQFHLDLNAIEQAVTPQTKVIIINSPHNPTGIIYTEEELRQLSGLLENKNRDRKMPIVCIEDAPYSLLVYGNNVFHSMLSFYPHTCHVNSFSKSLGVPVERIGYVAFHPEMLGNGEYKKMLSRAVENNIRETVVNAPGLQQRAIAELGCFATGEIQRYEYRINLLADTLETQGFRLQRPGGAFYLFPEIPGIFQDEPEFRRYARMGDEPLIYTPGNAFGPGYERHIRLSACCDYKEAEIACRRLVEICQAKRAD